MRDHCFISSELKVLRSGRGLACKEKAGVKMSRGGQMKQPLWLLVYGVLATSGRTETGNRKNAPIVSVSWSSLLYGAWGYTDSGSHSLRGDGGNVSVQGTHQNTEAMQREREMG